MEKYPIFTFELPKNECRFSDVEQIMEYLKEQISANSIAVFIGDFDHYAHTYSIGGEINTDIHAAKMVVFCFGQKLPKPEMMAARPRSISVCDMGSHFFFTFLEAPMPAINEVIEGWIKATIKA